MAAWYAVVAPLAAAVIIGIAWLLACYLDERSFPLVCYVGNGCIFTALFLLITAIVASFVSLFGIRRHGKRVIVWKASVGFVLSCLVFMAPIVVVAWVFRGCLAVTSANMAKMAKTEAAMRVDTQDFAVKADEMIGTLVESSILDKAAHHPAVIAIGRIVNNTALSIDTDLLMKKIRVNLNKSGKAVTDTTGGTNDVDFNFSGRIVQPLNIRDGNKTQRTYVFQLSLTDNNGLAVWEEEKEVGKLTNILQQIKSE